MRFQRSSLRPLNKTHWKDILRVSFVRLTPFYQLRNPIMFVVYLGAIFTGIETLTLLNANEQAGYSFAISGTLWLTVLFANFSESYAEKRGQVQSDFLKRTRNDIEARRLRNAKNMDSYEKVPARALKKDDLFLVKTGDVIPVDGQIIEGIASVDESAITGESAPVIRESGSDRDTVTGGTRILSDWLIVRVTRNHGESYLDKMISMVEGAQRQKTPNEMALTILLVSMTLLLLVSCASLFPFSVFINSISGQGKIIGITTLTALFVCLAPTTIGGLLSAIGIAGMNRLIRTNIIATSAHAVEIAGEVNILLLDKTGTITYGNRQATAFIPALGTPPTELIEASLLASYTDQTTEGKSIIQLIKRLYGLSPEKPEGDIVNIPFSAETRISGITVGDKSFLKGASDTIDSYVKKLGGLIPQDVTTQIDKIARQGGTPLVVTQGPRVLGIIHLKDVIKEGMKERLTALRIMGIKSVMLTGDNPLTAAAIASEAGVDDFIAQTTPEAKLKLIRRMQESGEVVAMVGDGLNDAPALAQADVAMAMNNGTQAAKEAANMIDLDSNPTKLIEVIKLGRQLLMTRGALTTFSYANDIAKFLAVMGPVFSITCPSLARFNLLHLSSPHNAVLATVIFNALIILFLLPIAMHGVTYRVISAERLLSRNLLIFGLGGLFVPFIGIKIIDSLLSLAGGF